MRADQRKFHYIYKITRVDGKFYIGMHSTDDLEDGYFGSGQLLWKSIKKHGKEKHSKQILEFLPSRKDLKDRERELVNEQLLGDAMCLNLKLGGEGGWEHLPPHVVRANAIRNSPYKLGYKHTPETRQKIATATSTKTQERWDSADPTLVASQKAATEAARKSEKRKVTMRERGHSQGSKNSQFGTLWVNQNGIAKKIKSDQLNEHFQEGWSRGRSQPRSTT